MGILKPWTFLCLFAHVVVANLSDDFYGEYKDAAHLFNHMTVDNETGVVYVGAVNRIYQLSANLSFMAEATTGPRQDDPRCPPPGRDCSFKKEQMDNYNKILIFNSLSKKLITCGSVYQGSCEVRETSNISLGTEYRSANVAANSPNASTVAYVGPGPLGEDVMYVATTYTATVLQEKAYRDQVPAISSRNINNRMFMYAKKAAVPWEKDSAIFLSPTIRQDYKIHYVSGFTSSGFSYFLTVQPESNIVSSVVKNISKIVQICQSDTTYNSYVDVPIICKHQGMDYNMIQAAGIVTPSANTAKLLGLQNKNTDILVATFSFVNPTNDSTNSAVCLYSMADIRDTIATNIKKCYSGDKTVSGAQYFNVGPFKCENFTHSLPTINEYLCNVRMENYAVIVGTVPIFATPIKTYYNELLTAITVTTSSDYLVAFVGTSTGLLKKLSVESWSAAREYGEVVVDLNGSAVRQDLCLDGKKQFLLVMTEHKVTRLKVEQCRKHANCSSCLAPRDPFCGWCSLENRCSLHSECSRSQSPLEWLSGDASQCIEITSVSPSSASVNVVKKLFLTISQLPRGSAYRCVFVELGWSSAATSWTFGTQCSTPNINSLGIDIGNTGSKTITLALNSTETGILFLKESFTFYNCSSFFSCSKCVDTPWSCNWCIFEHKCVEADHQCNSGLVAGLQSVVQDDFPKRGPRHCPRIDATFTGHVYLPNSVPKEVFVRGNHLPIPKPGQNGYRCSLRTETGAVSSSAMRLDSGTVKCFIKAYTYAARQKTQNGNLSVFWGDNFKVEDKEGLQVTIYKCEVIGSGECGLCKSENYKNSDLRCQWCDGNCKYSDQCLHAISDGGSCPAPEIHNVEPLSGPLGGGTNVTIEGKNLGAKFEDIKNGIQVAGIPCIPFEELYQPSRRIVCRTSMSRAISSGHVTVTAGSTATYNRLFYYKLPRLLRITPVLGPQSGGTIITVSGRHLKTGGVISAFINSTPCAIDWSRFTDNITVCISNAAPAPGQGDFTMRFDDHEETLEDQYQYVTDPTVSKISPRESFVSGGRSIGVIGTNLHSIQQSWMYACFGTCQSYTEKTRCTSLNTTHMVCPSPKLLHVDLHKTKALQATAYIMFQMDNVQSVKNLSKHLSKMKYYFDPLVQNFSESESIKKVKGEVLIIEGKHLNLAAKEQDIQVFVGRELCHVTTVSDNKLVCRLPKEQPLDEDGGNFPPVVRVQFGNFKISVGRVEYDVSQQFQFPMEAIAGIAAAGGFLVFIIVIILIIYRRKNTQSERIYKKMQVQLDNLESNVRNECKQAFAELQTDMTDLTSDLVSSGIPFWDYHTYTFKVLFPGMSDHVILHSPMPKHSRAKHTELGFAHFQHLMNNKYFLLTFIRTLEDQKNFSIRDKVNVASLLLIIYQNNMEYSTEIMKCLLSELVDKSVSGKHPKLMLRRTESVVEKLLTNWLSLCMYKYLKESAGSSLFMMYKAIKMQVEKGPVDVVTGDARYSLSEDRLLRENIQPKLISVTVDHDGEILNCKSLNCDSISQVKEKLVELFYKNTPYSVRPKAHELELEWRNGRSGHLTLQDEDVTTLSKDGWKQLNTFEHYQVQDGAYLCLSRRVQSIKNVNGSLDMSAVSVNSAMPFMKKEWDSGTKYWHLVKHEDTQVKDGGLKMISEIFLTRLLSTKGTLQKFVDDLFQTILSASTPSLPPVIKYLFDFLDDAAARNNITDPDVVHTWKSNSLPLRFWVNIIKNPDFVFDVHKPSIVDSCLSVIAQTFMDSCSTADHRLGKDSPSNKLLYAKDIPTYKKLLEKFYKDIHDQPAVSDQDMNTFLAEVSRMCPNKFYTSSALRELFTYVSKYNHQILDALDEDPITQKQQLSSKLEQVLVTIEGHQNKIAYV